MGLELESAVRRSLRPWWKFLYFTPLVVFWGAVGYALNGLRGCGITALVPACLSTAWFVVRYFRSLRRGAGIDALAAEGRWDAALARLQTTPPDWPGDAVQAAIGLCYERLGRPAQADLVLSEAERKHGLTPSVKALRDALCERGTEAAPGPTDYPQARSLLPPPDYYGHFLRHLVVPGVGLCLLALCLFVLWCLMGGVMRWVGLIGVAWLFCFVLFEAAFGAGPQLHACREIQRLAATGQWHAAVEEIWRWRRQPSADRGVFTLEPIVAALLAYCYEGQGLPEWTDVLGEQMNRKWPREYVIQEFRRWLERERARQKEEDGRVEGAMMAAQGGEGDGV